jgi:hypothetical protein
MKQENDNSQQINIEISEPEAQVFIQIWLLLPSICQIS